MLGRRRLEEAQTTGTARSSGKMNPRDPLSRSGGDSADSGLGWAHTGALKMDGVGGGAGGGPRSR